MKTSSGESASPFFEGRSSRTVVAGRGGDGSFLSVMPALFHQAAGLPRALHGPPSAQWSSTGGRTSGAVGGARAARRRAAVVGPFAAALEDDVEHRDQEDAEGAGNQHAGEHRR